MVTVVIVLLLIEAGRSSRVMATVLRSSVDRLFDVLGGWSCRSLRQGALL